MTQREDAIRWNQGDSEGTAQRCHRKQSSDDEPPQQPVHQLGPNDDEYWEHLEVLAMTTIGAIEAREQNAAATMASMTHIPNSSRY